MFKMPDGDHNAYIYLIYQRTCTTVVNNYLRNGYLWDNVRVMGEWE